MAERIRGEVQDLERVIQRALVSWSRAKEKPVESAYIDSVALNLHGFYSGLERLFELVAKHLDQEVPAGEAWHRDLLQRMVMDIEEVRPAVIDSDIALELDEFRRFRHLVRNVYSLNLIPERMSRPMTLLPGLWKTLRSELLAFADFLEELALASPE
jgi:hypothetical protein